MVKSMADHTRSLLLSALKNLVADAGAQESHLRQIGSWPSLDELALDFDEVAQASRRRDALVALPHAGRRHASH
jgi:hypothetical protein